MKNILSIMLFLACASVFATNGTGDVNDQNYPQVGDVLVIGESNTYKYNHIDFPRLNMIVKRGGIASYKTVHGNEVVVKAVEEKPDGTTEVIIERRNGKKFFRHLKSVKADFNKAIDSGELVVKNN